MSKSENNSMSANKVQRIKFNVYKRNLPLFYMIFLQLPIFFTSVPSCCVLSYAVHIQDTITPAEWITD